MAGLSEDVLFTAPLVAANVANPLLKEIQSELGEENRKFSFLCGHDSNIASVLASLGATDYELSATVERKTPIGGKLVFSRWTDADGKEFISVDMVYQTTEQLQNVSLLDLENPPMSETVALDGLLANEQGLYAAEEVEARIKQAIDEYDEICGEYAMDAAARERMQRDPLSRSGRTIAQMISVWNQQDRLPASRNESFL